ncbi:MAG: hypothetical protein ACRERY_07665 [Pseudomonas sp.]
MAHIADAVSRLAQAGAKRFLVVGSTDLSLLPAVVRFGQVEQARRYRHWVNDALPARLASLGQGLELSYFDPGALGARIRAAAGEYGLRELNAPCQPTLPQVQAACASPDAYYFWDEWHPTQRVHALLGEAMARLYGG